MSGPERKVQLVRHLGACLADLFFLPFLSLYHPLVVLHHFFFVSHTLSSFPSVSVITALVGIATGIADRERTKGRDKERRRGRRERIVFI